MSEPKIVVVIGATGAQGGGLARAILADPAGGFAVRALTRRPESAAATRLRQMGAEVVSADSDDVESLKRAFAGSYAAYCVTNFWEHFSTDRELSQAAAMASAARCAGVRHVIWSTLEDTRRYIPLTSDLMPTLRNKYKVPHFDGKGEANDLFVCAQVPTTFLLTSFYWDNLIDFDSTRMGRDADGTLTLTMPMGRAKLPGIAAEDIGRCAYGILKSGSEFLGGSVGIAGEHLTGAEMAAALTNALGQAVRYADVSTGVYRALDIPGAEDLSNMFQFKRDFQDVFCGTRDVGLSRRLNPSLQTFGDWLAANKHRIPVS